MASMRTSAFGMLVYGSHFAICRRVTELYHAQLGNGISGNHSDNFGSSSIGCRLFLARYATCNFPRQSWFDCVSSTRRNAAFLLWYFDLIMRISYLHKHYMMMIFEYGLKIHISVLHLTVLWRLAFQLHGYCDIDWIMLWIFERSALSMPIVSISASVIIKNTSKSI